MSVSKIFILLFFFVNSEICEIGSKKACEVRKAFSLELSEKKSLKKSEKKITEEHNKEIRVTDYAQKFKVVLKFDAFCKAQININKYL